MTDIKYILELVEAAKKSSFDDMYIKELEDQLMPYDEFRVHKMLLLYVPPVLLVLGTLGNVFSFIILTRRQMRSVSSYIYLAVLSITDTLVLHVGLLRLWVGELTRFDIRDHSDWICKCINVFGYTVSDYSVWLIVAVTVERYIAVCHALKAPAMCNRRRAAKVIVGTGLVIFAINFHFFFTTEIRYSSIDGSDDVMGQCNPAKGFDHFIKFWHWVDAIIYSFLPFIGLSVLNGLIIQKVYLAKRARNQLSAHVNSDRQGGRSPGHQTSSSSSSRGTESNARLTVMLLTISFAFVITTLPMNINLILTFYWNAKAGSLEQEAKFGLFAKATMVRTITELLMYTNHSMNFFLYCATGQRFRQQLCNLFCSRRRRGRSANGAPSNAYQTEMTQLQLNKLDVCKRTQVAEHSREGHRKVHYAPIQDNRFS